MIDALGTWQKWSGNGPASPGQHRSGSLGGRFDVFGPSRDRSTAARRCSRQHDLFASRIGVSAELAALAALAALSELAGGAWDLPDIGAEDLRQACSTIECYADQQIGVADASNVVLAARYRTRTIVTRDRRHFDVVRPLTGGRFTVLSWRRE